MLSDEIRARLEQLNRQELPQPTSPLRLANTSGAEAASVAILDPWYARTVRYFEVGREVENPAGRHLTIVHSVSRFGSEITGQLDRVRRAWLARNVESLPVHRDVAKLGAAFPDGMLFLDLETCGLGGAMIFLVGLLHVTSEGLVLEQLLARNYAEERAILASLWRIAAGKRVLVTFNGKSFDWPLVHDRSTLHRLGRRDFHAPPAASSAELLQPQDPRPEPAHFDVLHHARRRWRHRLPNCRLQTLERYLCRRVRHDDVPGHLIPQAYHDFVRSGDSRLIESILHHNALDLVTMTQVAMRMLMENAVAAGANEVEIPLKRA